MAASPPPVVLVPRGEGLRPADEAALRSVLAAGGVVVFPTDTFYGLGADPFSPAGVAKALSLKKRPPSKPLLVLLADGAEVERFAEVPSGRHRALMARFWPGPLTLLFRARTGLPPALLSGEGEVALRVPGSALCRAVLRAAGGALTGTSANRGGDAPPGSPAAAALSLGDGVDLVVDGGTLPPSEVSTILSVTGAGTVILREGAVAAEEVMACLAPRDGKEERA